MDSKNRLINTDTLDGFYPLDFDRIDGEKP